MPDEVLVYVLGHLGEPPAPIDQNVLDRMLSTDRGKEMQAWVPPQPTIGEMKEQYGDRTMSDEELLRRYLVPLQDVEATHAAGPAPRTYHFEDDGDPRVAHQRPVGRTAGVLRAHRDRDVGDHAPTLTQAGLRIRLRKGRTL